MSTINERFKIIRKLLNYNQKDFAEELGISQTHISGIESGKDNPSIPILKLISLKFNINEKWLISGEGSPDSNCKIMPNNNELMRYSEIENLLISHFKDIEKLGELLGYKVEFVKDDK